MNKTLVFTDQELNIILFALQKQPFEMVNDLMHNIVNQLKAQQIKSDLSQTELKTE